MEQNPQFAQPEHGPPPASPSLPAITLASHVVLFGSLGWLLFQTRTWAVMYEDLGAELPVPSMILMKLNQLMLSFGIPLFVLAAVGLAMDVGVFLILRRRAGHRDAENWLAISGSAVSLAIPFVLFAVFSPFLELIDSMK